MTIVFQGISQKNYIIGNDTVVGYSKKENRTIAIIFQDRHKLEELNFDNELIIYNLDNSNKKLKDNIKQYILNDSISSAKNFKLKNDLAKETKSKETWMNIGKGGIVGTIIFIVISILKK